MAYSKNNFSNNAAFDRQYYNYLITDALLTVAEAAIVTNEISIFKKEFESGNIFVNKVALKSMKEVPMDISNETILQHYLRVALQCGQLDFIKYMIEELKVNLPPEELLEHLFQQSRYEVKKNTNQLIEIYNYLIQKGFNLDDQDLIKTLFLKEAKEGYFEAIHALLGLNRVSNINCTDDDGHTVLYYSLLENNIVSSEQLQKSGASLSDKDRSVLMSIRLIDSIILEMTTSNEEKLTELRALLQFTNFRSVPDNVINRCIFKAIDMNDVKTLQILLPFCNESIFSSMFNKCNSLTLASLVIKHFIKQEVPQQGSLAEYAHRLGLNEYPSGYSMSYQFLLHVLKEFRRVNDNETIQTIFESLQLTSLLNKTSNPELARSLFYQTYSEGKLSILPVGWREHAVGLAVLWNEKSNKTYVLFSNRGLGGINSCVIDKNLLSKQNQYGSVIYELEGKLDKTFFSHFQIGENLPGAFKYKQKKFEQDVVQCLNGAKILQPFILAAPQKYGTCSYVNLKQLIHGLLCIFNITQGESYSNELIINTKLLYKYLSNFDKNSACLDIKQYCRVERDLYAGDLLDFLKEAQDFVVKLILSHSMSKKPEDIERMKQLFTILPQEVQNKLKFILPEQLTSVSSDVQSSALKDLSLFKPSQDDSSFSKSYLLNPIKVETKSVDALIEKMDQISLLLKFFDSKGCTGSDIIGIYLNENGSVRINTKADRNIKYKIRDLFPAELITNVDGVFAFIIKDLNKINEILNIPAASSTKNL